MLAFLFRLLEIVKNTGKRANIGIVSKEDAEADVPRIQAGGCIILCSIRSKPHAGSKKGASNERGFSSMLKTSEFTPK